MINILSIIFRRKLLIILFSASVVFVVALASFLRPPVYKASAKLLIEREMDSEKVLLFRMNMPVAYEKHDWINSEIEIIKSYPVAKRIVQEFNLHREGQDDIRGSLEERNDIFKRSVFTFQKKLKVEKKKLSNVLVIEFEDKDADRTADIVNRVIDTYVDYRSEMYDESDAYNFFEEQMRIADGKLRELEQNQASYKGDKALISPDSHRQILLTRMEEYEKSLTKVRTERIGKEARLCVIKNQMRDGQKFHIPSTEASNSMSREKHIAKLRGEMLDLQLKREQLLQVYTKEYEEVINIEKQITATEKQIENEIEQIIKMEETAIEALLAEEAALQESISRTSEEIKSFAQREYEFAQISRGIEDNREVYSMLLKQREEARISLAKLQTGVRTKIISPAVVPSDPIKPRKALNIILALFFGTFLGFCLAFIVEYLNHSLSNTAEVERFTGLTVLGSVRDGDILINNKEKPDNKNRIIAA